MLLNNELNITNERKKYNEYRIIFKDLADNLQEEFRKIYRQNNKSLDDVSRFSYAQGSNCIAKAIKKAVEMLISKGIYHIDEERFIQDYYLNYHIWDDYYNDINEKYLEITLDGKQLDEYRKIRRENRGRLVGGGFGLEGAVEGIVTAGAVNLAFGAVHGVVNGIGKMISAGIAANKKSKVFNDPETLRTLATGVYYAVFRIHNALIDAINKNSDSKIEGYVLADESKRAHSMFNNLNKMEFDSETSSKLIKEIFELDPYNIDYYEFLIDKYGDGNLEIQKVADYFGVYINDYKYNIAVRFYNDLISKLEKSEEATIHSRQLFIQRANYIGLKDSDEFIKEFDEILHEFDIRARTVDGVVLETREEAIRAKEEKNKLDELRSKTDYNSEESLIQTKNQIIENQLKTKIAQDYLKSIEDKLKDLTKYKRTVDGVLYETVEEAELAKAEIPKLEELIRNTDFNSRESLYETKNKIMDYQFKAKAALEYIRLIEDNLATINERERTFEGITFETIDEKELAKEEKKVIEDLYSKVDKENEEELIRLKDNISISIKTKIKENYLKKIDNQLESFKGVRALEGLEKQLSEIDTTTPRDLEKLLAEAKSYRQKVKGANEFINKLEKTLKENKAEYAKKYKSAKEHEKTKNKSFIGRAFSGIVAMFVYAVLGIILYTFFGLIGFIISLIWPLSYIRVNSYNKKVWNELTRNGAILLYEFKQ
jgi:hypothetical protein